MLTYRVGRENIKMEPEPLNVSSIVWNETEHRLFLTAQNHKMRNGESVMFTRTDGSEIAFRASREIVEVIDNNTLKLNDFDKQFIPITDSGIYNFQYHPNYNKRKFIGLFLPSNEAHDVLENRDDIIIKERVYGNYSDYIHGMKRCDGDYVLYEDKFLYQVNAGEDKYGFPTDRYSYLNILVNVYVIPNDILSAYLYSIDRQYGNTWEYDGNVLILYNCIVPSRLNGHDDRTKFLWEIEEENIASYIIENLSECAFYVMDERFIYPTGEVAENGLICAKKTGVNILNPTYSVAISDAIFQDFGTNLFQEELLQSEYINKIIENAKNHIIDYEKQCFTPVYRDNDGKLLDIREIFFNLHFRKREAEWSDEYKTCTYGEWKTNDNLFWNNYNYEGGNTLIKINPDLSESDADLLGYLGFTDNDIYYRRNKVGRSFLRLMFFDTPDRRTQSLLYTAVMYLNTGSLYEKYVTDARNDEKTGKICDNASPEFVFTEGATKRLDASFSCKNKYESDTSSEGFYLYLFPGILDENGSAIIYLKAEFNHAKYGYTIPLIMPMDANGNPILPTSANFPIDYVARKDDDSEYVDTTRLFGDMYVPIKIEFDSESNRYIWYVDTGLQNNGIANFNMYEPKINRTDGINASLDSYTIGWRGGNIHGSIEIGDGKKWSVSSKSEGIASVTPESGYGQNDFIINITQNSDRTKTMEHYVVFSGVNSYVRVEIAQDANGFSLEMEPNDVVGVHWDGESVPIEIITEEDTEWRVTSKSSGLSVIPSGGTGPGEIRCAISKTDSFDEKSVYFYIQDTEMIGAPRIFTALVEGVPTGGIGFGPEAYIEFSDDGTTVQEIEIYDSDGIGWKITQDVPWLIFDVTEGTGNRNVHVRAAENNLTETRDGTITINFGAGTKMPESEYIKEYITAWQDSRKGTRALCYISNSAAYVTGLDDGINYFYTLTAIADIVPTEGSTISLCHNISDGHVRNNEIIPKVFCSDIVNVSNFIGQDITISWSINIAFDDGTSAQNSGNTSVHVPSVESKWETIRIPIDLGIINLTMTN